jgi:hypothetical protein
MNNVLKYGKYFIILIFVTGSINELFRIYKPKPEKSKPEVEILNPVEASSGSGRMLHFDVRNNSEKPKMYIGLVATWVDKNDNSIDSTITGINDLPKKSIQTVDIKIPENPNYLTYKLRISKVY